MFSFASIENSSSLSSSLKKLDMSSPCPHCPHSNKTKIRAYFKLANPHIVMASTVKVFDRSGNWQQPHITMSIFGRCCFSSCRFSTALNFRSLDGTGSVSLTTITRHQVTVVQYSNIFQEQTLHKLWRGGRQCEPIGCLGVWPQWGQSGRPWSWVTGVIGAQQSQKVVLISGALGY